MAAHWGYGKNNGPNTWGKHWPIAHNPVTGQSPIDIQTDDTVPPPSDWSTLQLHFRPERCTRLHNNGHGVQVDVTPPGEGKEEEDYNVRGGPLTSNFRLAQFHFHWGRDGSEGSEHTINGKSYAAEIHFVHYNCEDYPSAQEALDKARGLAVLGVLLKVGDENKALQTLIDKLEKISYEGDAVTLEGGYDIQRLIPNNHDYWHYQGSLTTPPLYESVNWIVFQKSLEISEEQLKAFRRLHSHPRDSDPDTHDEYKGHILCNFRPPQPQDFVRNLDDGDKEVTRTVYSVTSRKRSRSSSGSDSSSSESDSDS